MSKYLENTREIAAYWAGLTAGLSHSEKIGPAMAESNKQWEELLKNSMKGNKENGDTDTSN